MILNTQLKLKPEVCAKYIIFKDPKDFDEMLLELKDEWEKPRDTQSNQMRSRKHGIASSFIGTFCVLRCGQTLVEAEDTCLIDDSLIHIDVHRNIHLINRLLAYEISWPSHEEQLLLIGMNDTFDSCLLIDCMDIQIQKHPADWYNFIFKSWKVGNAYRNLLVVDLRGMIRAVTSVGAGYTNDQFVLAVSNFFRQGSLAPNTSALSDGGFTGSADFPIDRPFTRAQRAINPWLIHYNQAVSKHKNTVERVNGIVKMQWEILQKPFQYQPSFFPAVFRCCCILTNRYFRLYGYPGLNDQ